MPNSPIYQACTARKGGYIPFSQSDEPVRSWIGGVDATAGGICQALSARWMIEHCNDSSLWKWLDYRRSGAGVVSVDRARIGDLMVAAAEFGDSSGKFANPQYKLTLDTFDALKPQLGDLQHQDFITSKYLKLYGGLIRRTLPAAVVQQERSLGLSPSGYMGFIMALRLNRRTLLSPGGSYALIGVKSHRRRSGHTMAAFIGQDVSFFDPNYGEFYFPPTGGVTHNQPFVDWFTNFWATTGYSQRYDSFRILSFGRDINYKPKRQGAPVEISF